MRARNIKPGFFSNDELAAIDPLGRILFIGLWCAADREGRLEDRPLRLKALLLPFDNCDIDQLLNELDRIGVISRYEVAGEQYIQVVNFAEHQHPHVKEKRSTIPAPGLTGASLVQTPEEPRINPSDSGSLIPDPGLLIPDSEDGAALEDEPAPDDDETEMTSAERAVAGYVREVRGMANVPSTEIIGHIRECLEIRGSPVSELTMRREMMNFRDHWNAKRNSQPMNQRWSRWKVAISNWITRIPEDPPANGTSVLDGLYPELQPIGVIDDE